MNDRLRILKSMFTRNGGRGITAILLLVVILGGMALPLPVFISGILFIFYIAILGCYWSS